MALKVRNAQEAADKFKTRAGAAQGDYQKGVAGAGAAWQEGAAASEDNYNQGVQAAIARGAFRRGVQAAGAAKYQERATTVGPQRYTQGVQVGAGDYARNVAPHLDAMRNATLAPRRPKGDPANIERVRQVNDLNRTIKLNRA